MDKVNVVYMYNLVLFILKREGNPAIWNNMVKLRGHYAKWNKPVTEERTNGTWFHLYEESKVTKLIEA